MPEEAPVRVLLIDDDEAAFVLTRAVLNQIPTARFELECAQTFEEGASAIAKGVHDVYLIDYMIGDDSGIELVRRAREVLNRAPMILLTGKGRYEVDVEAMAAGVSDYLDKSSVAPDLLERSIRYAIERVRAETALRESETRHRSMFDHLPIGLYRTSENGALVDVNPALVNLLDNPGRDLLEFEYARNFFVNPAHRQTFLDRLDQFGVVRGFETDLKRPDGEVVHVRNAARSHRDEHGRTLYIEGAVEDVTDEREAHDLHGRAARFGWIYDGSGVSIVLTDLEGTILDANPAFLRTFGYTPKALRGRPLAELADPGDHDALAAEVARVASGAADTCAAERRFLAADGEVMWARTRTGLVRTAKGQPDHLLVLLEDVAEA